MNKILGIVTLTAALTTASYAGNPVSAQYVDNQIQNVRLEIQNINNQLQTQIINSPKTYTAGTGISISGTVISATGTTITYSAGSGISISGNVISSTVTPITYTAGSGISISGNVISSTVTPTTYTAGSGISISGNVISSTITPITYTAGSGISISGTVISSTVTPITYTAGSGISISGNVISSTITPTTYTAGTGISISAGNVISVSSTTYTLGQYAQGGVIYWLDPTKTHGLVAAISDQDGGSGVQWYNGTFTQVGSFADGIYTGAANTAGIIASQGAGTYAASVCTAYSVTVNSVTYNDWYLPNLTELDLMWLNKTIINATSVANGGANLASAAYWASAETNSTTANAQDLGTGTRSSGNNKSSLLRVRAIRAF